MENFDLILKDYANWKLDNVETIEALKHNRSLIYQRLEPIYLVLNALYDEAVENEGLEEDKATIFQMGLNYLHDQFAIIRIYYEKLFDSDCAAFETYTPLVVYLLFISDFREDIEEKTDAFDDSELNNIETIIENMIAERRKEFDVVAARLKKAIDTISAEVGFEHVSIIDIFVEIAEHLDIELESGRTWVLGEDI